MKTVMVAGPRELGVHAFWVSISIDDYFREARERLRVIHGAARGVDSICAEAAARYGHDVIAYTVNELDREIAARRHRGSTRKAPLYRTIRMLESENPDLLQAWWDGESSGTGFTITQARRRGITTNVVSIQEGIR